MHAGRYFTVYVIVRRTFDFIRDPHTISTTRNTRHVTRSRPSNRVVYRFYRLCGVHPLKGLSQVERGHARVVLRSGRVFEEIGPAGKGPHP